MRETTLAVVGAGPGGYAAAFRAADLGLRVTLVDPEPNPGGVCLFRGCIPSKALLHVAKIVRDAEHAKAWGVTFERPAIDLVAMRRWKESVVAKLTGGLGTLGKARGVEYLRGRATFRDGHTLEIQGEGGAADVRAFDFIILASGSRPQLPPGLDLDSPRLMTSTGALELAEVPATLLVVGGGYIGLELATVYAALGARVTVVELTPQLLPGVDPDLVRVLAREVEGTLDSVRLRTRVADLRIARDGRLQARLETEGGDGEDAVFDRALVAVGRKPNSSGLGLQTTRAEIDARGFVVVDVQRRTAEPSVFAIGDVAGEPMLAHKATHEGIVAAEVIAGQAAAFEPNAIPAVVFTDPEIAWCGMTEEQAKRNGVEHTVARYPWQASGRALALDRPEGLTKLIVENGSGRLLGVGIVGDGAGELIAEGVLAIEMGAVAADVAMTIHAHPTMSESVMEAAHVALGQSVHLYRKPRR